MVRTEYDSADKCPCGPKKAEAKKGRNWDWGKWVGGGKGYADFLGA